MDLVRLSRLPGGNHLLKGSMCAIVHQMPAPDLLSAADAARRLGVHPSRVRALLAAGKLRGFKLGGNWVVEAASIRHRLAGSSAPGRPLEAANAWGALFLASGDLADWLTPDARWRARKL